MSHWQIAEIDDDGDGKISADELRNFIERRAECGVSAGLISHMVTTLDRDGDGMVDAHELAAIVT